MKKTFFISFGFCFLFFISCEKDIATPDASFTLSGLNAAGAPVTINEGVATSGVARVIFRYTGTPSDFRVIYSGDSTHMKVDPANPGIAKGVQSGLDFLKDTISYVYKPGTYTISVISTNVGNKGKDINRSTATKTIILQ